jgi:hypothetical protein
MHQQTLPHVALARALCALEVDVDASPQRSRSCCASGGASPGQPQRQRGQDRPSPPVPSLCPTVGSSGDPLRARRPIRSVVRSRWASVARLSSAPDQIGLRLTGGEAPSEARSPAQRLATKKPAPTPICVRDRRGAVATWIGAGGGCWAFLAGRRRWRVSRSWRWCWPCAWRRRCWSPGPRAARALLGCPHDPASVAIRSAW